MVYEEANISNLKQPVIIYGAGVFGELAYFALKELNILPVFFCDRAKENKTMFDLPVVFPDELVKYKDASILMAVSASFYEVSKYLEEIGCNNVFSIKDLLNNCSFERYKSSKSVMDIAHYRNLYENGLKYRPNGNNIDLLSLDYVITEKCTLKCKDCANLMQYYKKPCDYDIVNLKNSLERLLESVNSIFDFRIIGGEPFLHKEFATVLEQFVNNPKINSISIFTNATILPKEKDIEWLKNTKFKVAVTDYKELSKNTQKFIGILRENNIRYIVTELTYWQDLGSLDFRNYTADQKKAVFKECDCRFLPTFLKGKLFLCPYSAHGNNLEAFCEKAFVDFNVVKEKATYKKEIGQLLYKKEFLTACGYCSGRSIKHNRINPAIQTKVPLEYERTAYE